MSLILCVVGLASIVVWIRVVAPRLGLALGVPTVATAHLAIVVAALLATHVLRIGAVWAVVAVLAVVGVVGIAAGMRMARERPWPKPSRRTVLVWSSAATGVVAWLLIRLLSIVVPGASVVSWAMEGDATNNLHFARRLLDENGIAIGADANPVPLTSSLIALALGERRDGTDLMTDLIAYGAVWTLLLAILCVVCSVAFTTLIPIGRPRLLVVFGVLGSLLPFGWLVAGLPIGAGYFNTHIALPLLVGAWLVFLSASRAPVVAIVVLAGIATLLLITWSPALLFPVALGAVLLVRHRSEVARIRGWNWSLPALAILAPIAIATTLTIPAFGVQQSALVAPGTGYASTLYLALALATIAVVLAALARRRIGAVVFAGVIGLAGAGYAGAAILLSLSAELFNPWDGYYVAKFLWLTTVLLLVVAGSITAAAAASVQHDRRRWFAVAGAAAGIAAVATGLVIPTDTGRLTPAQLILGGNVWQTGDEAVAVISALSARDEVSIVWDSESPDEAMINYWTLDAAGGHIGGDETLRRFSFEEYSAFRQLGTHDSAARNGLCRVLRSPDHDVVIYTQKETLESELTETCTGSSARFVVGALPGS